MTNNPGERFPRGFRSGQALSAAGLNEIVQALVRQIVGGDGIQVQSFGNRIVINQIANKKRRTPAGYFNTVETVSGSDLHALDNPDLGTLYKYEGGSWVPMTSSNCEGSPIGLVITSSSDEFTLLLNGFTTLSLGSSLDAELFVGEDGAVSGTPVFIDGNAKIISLGRRFSSSLFYFSPRLVTHKAEFTPVDTDNFENNLNESDTTVQKALEHIDSLEFPGDRIDPEFDTDSLDVLTFYDLDYSTAHATGTLVISGRTYYGRNLDRDDEISAQIRFSIEAGMLRLIGISKTLVLNIGTAQETDEESSHTHTYDGSTTSSGSAHLHTFRDHEVMISEDPVYDACSLSSLGTWYDTDIELKIEVNWLEDDTTDVYDAKLQAQLDSSATPNLKFRLIKITNDFISRTLVGMIDAQYET